MTISTTQWRRAFPPPGCGVLSKSIPLFFIGRNRTVFGLHLAAAVPAGSFC
jgi:hypothetical protein